MPVNTSPSALFSGYSSDGTTISIPIEDIIGLTTEKADTATGNWISIFSAICATVFLHYNSLPTADKPRTFVSSPPTQYSVTTGALSGSFRQTYNNQFWTEFHPADIVDEPT